MRRNRPTSPSIPPFSCAPPLARPGEARFEQVLRSRRDEPVRLHPPAAAQDPLDRRTQVVIADQGEHATKELERGNVTFEERLLALARVACAKHVREKDARI